jgi:hypothetical protein
MSMKNFFSSPEAHPQMRKMRCLPIPAEVHRLNENQAAKLLVKRLVDGRQVGVRMIPRRKVKRESDCKDASIQNADTL